MNIKQIISRLVREESGQDLIEYALVASLIGLAAVCAIRAPSTEIYSSFNAVGSTLTSST